METFGNTGGQVEKEGIFLEKDFLPEMAVENEAKGSITPRWVRWRLVHGRFIRRA